MVIYKNRYQANKHKSYGYVVVKVDGGYTVMTAQDYLIWKNQK